MINEMPYGVDGRFTIDFRVELWDINSNEKSFILKKIEKEKDYYIEQYHNMEYDPGFIHRDSGFKNDIVLVNMYKNLGKIIEA